MALESAFINMRLIQHGWMLALPATVVSKGKLPEDAKWWHDYPEYWHDRDADQWRYEYSAFSVHHPKFTKSVKSMFTESDRMPYKVVKRSGSRPYKIIKSDTGKVVGSSTSRSAAQASIRARYMGEAKGKKK